MLAVTSYKPAYVAECRKAVSDQLKAFRALPKSDALDAFAPQFFNHMVLALDHYFLHRLRAAELKDGNPINEVRMLCNAIHDNGGVLARDTQIKLDPKTSVTKLAFGEKIALDEKTFAKLATAFFDEIERKYP